jgi:hypothetical protein
VNETPEFWTPQELTEEEINKICSWLMAWQKAVVTAESLMDVDPLTQTLLTSRLDSNFLRAMSYVQDLVRHIGALREKEKE